MEWITQGLVAAAPLWPVAIAGAFIFRLVHFPDLGIEGSFVVGAGIATQCCIAGLPLPISLAISFCAGSLMGAITAGLFVWGRVNAILCGIVTGSAGYTIAWVVLGQQAFQGVPDGYSLPPWSIVLSTLAALIAVLSLLSSSFGLRLRFSAERPELVNQFGLRAPLWVGAQVIAGNAMVGVGGACVALNGGTATLNLGDGVLFKVLTFIVVGEAVMIAVFRALQHQSYGVPRLSKFAWARLLDGFGSGVVVLACSMGLLLFHVLEQIVWDLFGANQWSRALMGLLIGLGAVVGALWGRSSKGLPAWHFHGYSKW
ncbi:hypothetical protein CKO31_23500 [Thiohalocapsa halophila]|uniref:ABC transporter permease n=1 Tax=Thiohalocapsa halophila TaxID=69359 RepID=A0ABS1CPA5_9GAMM|nr:hypothetical protein [Thiohalocapsa halophila]MBK1633653.1 hypothetical protein [Thiohalocapsa halophila]